METVVQEVPQDAVLLNLSSDPMTLEERTGAPPALAGDVEEALFLEVVLPQGRIAAQIAALKARRVAQAPRGSHVFPPTAGLRYCSGPERRTYCRLQKRQ